MFKQVKGEKIFSTWSQNKKAKYFAAYDEQLRSGHAVKLVCDHFYRRECIRQWLQEEKVGTCPYCRLDIAKYSVVENDANGENEGYDDEDDEYNDNEDDEDDEEEEYI